MASWPSLPDPLASSYQETPAETTIRTRMDAGPDKVRRRFTAGVTGLSFTLLLSKTQVATLDAFYSTTVSGGADEFDYTHPRTGSAVKARFVSTPSYSSVDPDNYRVSIELEILP